MDETMKKLHQNTCNILIINLGRSEFTFEVNKIHFNNMAHKITGCKMHSQDLQQKAS